MGDNSEDFLDVLTAVQEGEFEVVQEVIGGRFVSANALDRTGCSLLHWAAINNRVVIARLLIEHGLTKASPGGVLGETPLHWAMRKKYYIMMELIFKHTQCDLSVKSTQGNDALLLACKLGDVNAAFLLLHWGANVETTDLNGDTPLLWLIRNKSTVPGTTAHEIIKLLLRFGASTLAANPADGNNTLHVLVTLPKIDLKTSFLLYQAAGPTGKLAVNRNNLTPYQLAVSTDRREMARFLYDAMMYDVLPYWSPTAAAAVLMAGLFFSIKMCGIIYGSVYWAILYTASSWTLLQWQVSDHRTRSTTGAFVGVLVCQLLSYRYNISHSVSSITNYITLAVVVVYLGSIFYFTRRKPLACNKAENRAQLAEQVLQSSPTEGTDEEFHLNNDEKEPETVDESSTLISKSSSVDGVRFVKDSFTGQLRRVDSNAPGNTTLTKPATTTSTTSNAYHGRGLGPKLCGACLCDRRIHTTSSNSSVVLPTSLENYFLPPTGSSKTTGRNRTDTISGLHTGGPPPGEVIAIATHCASCDVCVVDQDHHSVLLGNCVGKGNRRLYWLFLLSGTLFCLIYFLTAKYVQHYETCADDAALMSGYGPLTWLRVEYCVLSRKGAFFALSWITAYLGFYLLVMLQIQVTCVVRETTYSNVTKQRYERMPPPSRRRMRTLLTFLYSGMYNVVYPKTSTRSRNNSMTSVDGNGKNTTNTSTSATTPTTPHKHDGCCGAPPAPVTSDSDKLQYERAMKMLKGIDLAISGKVEDEEVPEVESVVETVTGKSATTTYTAPVDLPLTPTTTSNTGGCGTHDCSHCEDEFSDYDTEFIESAQNNYATYYFQDSDDEGDHSSGPSAKNSHSSGAILDHSSGHDHGHGHSSGGHVHTSACNHDHSHSHSTSPYSTHNHSHDHSHSSSSNLKGVSSKNSVKSSKNNSTSISADDRV